MFAIADALQPRICSDLLNSGRPEKAYYRRVAMYDWLTISSSVNVAAGYGRRVSLSCKLRNEEPVNRETISIDVEINRFSKSSGRRRTL